MKKTLIAVAALAATGAFAQVSVYGRLDVGYANTKTTNGAVETKANGVQSHNSASSMWGIQGSEDLGGGLKANFKLEQDLYVANGNTGNSGAGGGTANSAGFNRTSLLGISGGFGRIDLGRDYVPTFKLAAATDVNAQSRMGTVQLASVAGSTSPNLIHYSTPNLSGFQVNLAVGNQDTSVSSNTTGATTVKTTNVTATYMNGPLMVGVGSGTVKGLTAGSASSNAAPVLINGATLAAANAEKISMTIVAGSYDLGVVKLVGNVINGKWTYATSDTKANEINVGAIVPFGKVSLIGQVGRNKIEVTGATEDVTGTDTVLGVNYALSAKTNLFAKTGTYGKASGNGIDVKQTSTAVGIRTVF